MPAEPSTDDDHLRLIESDLHFRAKQLRAFGVDTKLVRALMKAAFDRFLTADEKEDQKTLVGKAWEIRIGDREVAIRKRDPLLGIVHARTRIEAEREAGKNEVIAAAFSRLGLPLGTGFWAIEARARDGITATCHVCQLVFDPTIGVGCPGCREIKAAR